jgi:hypothetical protein
MLLPSDVMLRIVMIEIQMLCCKTATEHFFILFHWERGGKIIWMMLVAKQGKSQLL